MGKAKAPKMVHCRYPKCTKLHESTELLKDDAVQGGKNSYYHPDCYHTMQTVNKIRDTFVKEIDPTLTGKQIGMLVSTINNIIFTKNVSVDYLNFVVNFFIHKKPGALKHPAGLHYAIQDRDAHDMWESLRKQKIKENIKKQQEEMKSETVDIDLPSNSFNYKPQKARSFADILQ